MVNLVVLSILSVHGVVPDLFRTTKVITKEKRKVEKKHHFILCVQYKLSRRKKNLIYLHIPISLACEYILGKAESEGCKNREGVLIGL